MMANPGTDNASRTPNAADDGYWQGTYQTSGVRPQAPRPARQVSAKEILTPKDHVAAALLAFFLGWLGIHKFYLGYYQTGFMMMAISIVGSVFTFGLASAVMEVIAIIEGVIYLTKSQTEFDVMYVVGRKEWF